MDRKSEKVQSASQYHFYFFQLHYLNQLTIKPAPLLPKVAIWITFFISAVLRSINEPNSIISKLWPFVYSHVLRFITLLGFFWAFKFLNIGDWDIWKEPVL